MPQVDDAARLDEDAPRCPACGKRVSTAMTVCPACGYALLPRRARIRCKRCASRIPADATVCPRCHGDPRAERWPARLGRGVAIVLAVVFAACLLWVLWRAVTTNAFARTFTASTPTTVPATVIHVIHVVASPVPPPLTATAEPTPTARVSPTPTRRGARPVTPVLTATPTLPPGFYPTPQLLAPAHLTVYTGTTTSILLEWLPVTPSGLRENEWYEVRLMYTTPQHTPGEYRHYTKETRWNVRSDWRNDIAPDAREIRWTVTVIRVEGVDPFTSAVRTPVSLSSMTRGFIWQ